MIKARDMDPFEPLYTFVTDSGENINIASQRLRAWANNRANGVEIVLVPCRRSVADKFIREGSVSRAHCRELAQKIHKGLVLWPVLLAQYGNVPIEADLAQEVICVDGHHTTVLYVLSGCVEMPAQFLTRAQWEPFKVTGLPDITQGELAAIPIMLIRFPHTNAETY